METKYHIKALSILLTIMIIIASVVSFILLAPPWLFITGIVSFLLFIVYSIIYEVVKSRDRNYW